MGHQRHQRGIRYGRGARYAAVAVLATAALVEAGLRTAGSGVTGHFAIAVGLLALAGTVPLALAEPLLAAVTITAATLLSLAPFHSLTVAGATAQTAALYGLGRGGGNGSAAGPYGPGRSAAGLAGPGRSAAALRGLGLGLGRRGGYGAAAVLAMPFLPLALAHPSGAGTETGVLTVLLASLAPVAAWAGIARHARGEARAHSAARQELTGTLLEHTARGERARIARELHDIVAHHISMVAVQAETARLTTPGMPPAGAQRLLAIGDTARDALTEMRRLLGVLREDTSPDARPHPPKAASLLDAIPDPSATEPSPPLLGGLRDGTGPPAPPPGAPGQPDAGPPLGRPRDSSAPEARPRGRGDFRPLDANSPPGAPFDSSATDTSAPRQPGLAQLGVHLDDTGPPAPPPGAAGSPLGRPRDSSATGPRPPAPLGGVAGRGPRPRGPVVAASRQPQPGLAQLNELLDEARETSGTGARLIVRGAAEPLDPGVELAAYRIVQEALTNARRHAPGAAVDVELHYAEETLALRVRDNGPGPPPAPPVGGLGLLGMRERAAAVGGELRTGPASGGGFLVETVLPTRAGTPR